jgi:hypothetical protein
MDTLILRTDVFCARVLVVALLILFAFWHLHARTFLAFQTTSRSPPTTSTHQTVKALVDTPIVNAKVQSAVILVITFRDGCALEGGTVIKPISILTCLIPSVCLEIIPTSNRGIILPPHAIFKRDLNL